MWLGGGEGRGGECGYVSPAIDKWGMDSQSYTRDAVRRGWGGVSGGGGGGGGGGRGGHMKRAVLQQLYVDTRMKRRTGC